MNHARYESTGSNTGHGRVINSCDKFGVIYYTDGKYRHAVIFNRLTHADTSRPSWHASCTPLIPFKCSARTRSWSDGLATAPSQASGDGPKSPLEGHATRCSYSNLCIYRYGSMG